MEIKEISNWLTNRFDHVVPKNSWGETSFFINPGNRLPSGAYFATLKEKDGDNDKASNLNREGVFRLNFGPGKVAFEPLFGKPPARPPKGGIIEGPWDFGAQNQLMPHPIYGWMSWMCILNPGTKMFDRCKPLLEQAYEKALASVHKRLEGSDQ